MNDSGAVLITVGIVIVVGLLVRGLRRVQFDDRVVDETFWTQARASREVERAVAEARSLVAAAEAERAAAPKSKPRRKSRSKSTKAKRKRAATLWDYLTQDDDDAPLH